MSRCAGADQGSWKKIIKLIYSRKHSSKDEKKKPKHSPGVPGYEDVLEEALVQILGPRPSLCLPLLVLLLELPPEELLPAEDDLGPDVHHQVVEQLQAQGQEGEGQDHGNDYGPALLTKDSNIYIYYSLFLLLSSS